jgi:hypothetical protein
MQETLHQSHFIASHTKKLSSDTATHIKMFSPSLQLFYLEKNGALHSRAIAKRLRDLDQLPAIYNEDTFSTDQ